MSVLQSLSNLRRGMSGVHLEANTKLAKTRRGKKRDV